MILEKINIAFLGEILSALLCFILGLSINRKDFFFQTFRPVNKWVFLCGLAINIAFVFLISPVGNYAEYYTPAVLTSTLLVSIWPANKKSRIRKSTLDTYSTGSILLIVAVFALKSRLPLPSTLDANQFLRSLFILLLQTYVLVQFFIWLLNKAVAKNLIVTTVYILITLILLVLLNARFTIYCGCLAGFVYGYFVRNTIFSAAYRKNLSRVSVSPGLFLILAIVTCMLSWAHLSVPITVLAGAVIGGLVLFFLEKFFTTVFIGNYFGYALLAVMVMCNISNLNFDTVTSGAALTFLVFAIIRSFAKSGMVASVTQPWLAGSGYREVNLGEINGSKQPLLYKEYLKYPLGSKLQDFSYSGYKYGEDETNGILGNLPVYNVKDFGIEPDQKVDVTKKIQECINKVGRDGGGVILFPSGEYYLNMDKKSPDYLQINYSNIILKGEGADTPSKSVFVSWNHTLVGHRNPWLSPFLITCGTHLQKRNIFWGLQFKKPKAIKTRSNSLTDPGSDGKIETAEFCCRLIKDSFKGERILAVENTLLLAGNRFILVGMYNTTDDGNLIKELLNRDVIDEEWKTALRAGPEKAPSFQWLVEIETVVDEHQLILKQPLRRDILLKFEPEIYLAPMIENIGILDISFKSKWNGVFRHHGAPLYFSTHQSQVMDYGWNAINFCRVAHGVMKNVSIENFTNPLYVQDSRNITVEQVFVSGHDGHQGIKLYGHSCDNLFRNITFANNYADMIGGEGNCYANVFSNVRYANFENKPADFDFHGFSEGPFSPPSYTLFENCHGLRGIKASGTIYNQPACALYNLWWNIDAEGYEGSTEIFKHDQYKSKNFIREIFSALYRATISCLQTKSFSPKAFIELYNTKKRGLAKIGLPRKKHYLLFKNTIILGYRNDYLMTVGGDPKAETNGFLFTEEVNGSGVLPLSLYDDQLKTRLGRGNGK